MSKIKFEYSIKRIASIPIQGKGLLPVGEVLEYEEIGDDRSVVVKLNDQLPADFKRQIEEHPESLVIEQFPTLGRNCIILPTIETGG